jgi:transposase
MQVVYERCAAIDVHQKTAVTTIMITQANGHVQKETRTFATMTSDLLRLDDWLHELGVTVVAMESTGVFWHPIFNILEEGREIILVNAQHMKAVPGRKTDVKDSEWLADLLRHGLLQASFIPPQPIRELRDLTRYRKTLVQERSREVNRLQKLLEGANIKLAVVATDVLGKSGRDMLEAVIGGEQDAEALAALARGRLRAKLPDLRKALEGRVQPRHRFLLQQILAHIDFLEHAISRVEREMELYLLPYEEAMALLQSIPGLQATTAAGILAEIGTDMSRFPSDKHLTSWAGVCPGSKVSAGKRLGGRTTRGDTHLQALLGEAAWAASHTKGTYLSAFYQRIARRRGKKKATVALERKLLVIIYHVLRTKKPYSELGPDYFDQMQKTRLERHHIHRLEQLGYTVTLTPKEAA